jgi:hypothetical protein
MRWERFQAMTDMLESANNDTAQFLVRDRDNMTASSNHLQSHGWGFYGGFMEVLWRFYGGFRESYEGNEQKIHF